MRTRPHRHLEADTVSMPRSPADEGEEPAPPPGDGRGALTPTLFHEPWWLDEVTRGQYEEARVYSGGRLAGRLPYVRSRRFGMTLLQMPMLTHFLGHAVEPTVGNAPARFLHELSVTKALIRQLPPVSHAYIKHHRETTNTAAYQAMGFLTDVQYTCEVEPASREALWYGMRDKTRNVIRRAEERFLVEDEIEPGDFSRLYSKHLNQKGRSNYYDPEICSAVIAESIRRGAGRVLAARDRDGEIKAAIFTVWDGDCEYYHMSTRTSDAGNGAVSLLVWCAMQHAAHRNVIFDFDGFKGPGDAHFYSGFGGTVRPRFISFIDTRRYKLFDRFTIKR